MSRSLFCYVRQGFVVCQVRVGYVLVGIYTMFGLKDWRERKGKNLEG